MKHKTFLMLLAAIALVVGCNKDETAARLEKAEADTKKAAAEMKDYTYAQKDAFVKKMQVQLDALKVELNDLSAKIEASSDKVKSEAKPKLQALRDQQSQLGVQFDKVKGATESTWENVKTGFNTAVDKSKEGFKSARQWLSEKIAP